jgi:N-methylhydantoinase B
MSDIGGTLSYGSSGSYFEEGLKIPPVKLLENGQSNEVVMDFIKSNVRSPAQVTGDIEAMLASTQVLESGVVRAMSGAGLTDLDTLGGEFQSRSENAMREALSSFPDGTYRGEARGSVFDEDFIVKVTIEVDGDEARVDFAGTSGESRYAVNCPYNYTYAFSAYALKCVLEPELPNNDGSFRPVHVTAPEGCLLNAVRPAAVEKRNRVGHLIPGAIFQAMSRATPRVMAQSGSAPITLDTFSHRKEGGGVSIHTISNNGGTGARPQGDGIQTAFPSNLSNTPVEITEASLPVRVHRKELLRDSEGAGRWRGGFGQVFEVENLGNAELTHSVLPTRSRYGAEGIDQGGDGSLHRVLLNGQEVELTVGRQTLVQGDVVRIEYPGGGGRGLPSTRDRETIQRDIYSGMLSPERAEKVYGYNKNNG